MKQLVIIGAGFDTKAYRFSELINANDITVFEVDEAKIQSEKKKLLAAEGWSNRVQYVPTDLATDDFAAQLKKAGFDASLPTVFSWESSASFLPAERVDKIVEFIGVSCALGSILCFDYINAEAHVNPSETDGYDQFKCWLAARGIALKFFGNSSTVEIPAFPFHSSTVTTKVEPLAKWLRDRNTGILRGMSQARLQQLIWRSDGGGSGLVAPYIDCVLAQTGYLPPLRVPQKRREQLVKPANKKFDDSLKEDVLASAAPPTAEVASGTGGKHSDAVTQRRKVGGGSSAGVEEEELKSKSRAVDATGAGGGKKRKSADEAVSKKKQ